jgi:Xaa-Pro aminopeptidase
LSYTDGWSRELLEGRVKKIRQYLAKNEMKALAVLNSLNFKYITGFFIDVSPWERPIIAVIPLDDDPFMVHCELSANHVKYALDNGRGLITDVRYYTEHPRQVNRLYTIREWTILVSEVFFEKNLTEGIIGVDINPESLKNKIGHHLPNLQFVDSSRLLREMRLIKSKEELELIRKAGKISDRAQMRYKEAIKIGKPWQALNAEVDFIMTQDICQKYPNYQIRVSTKGTGMSVFSAMPHGPGGYDGRIIQKGDVIINGPWIWLNGYNVENERTFIVGKPSEKQKKIFEVMTKAQEMGVEMCVEGNKVSDIDAVCQEVIEKSGYGDYIMHRTGHGKGLAGHEYFDDMAFNHRKLKEGMVTSVEPGIYIYGFGGFRHSDTVIVGKNKPENTTQYTKKIEDLTVCI